MLVLVRQGTFGRQYYPVLQVLDYYHSGEIRVLNSREFEIERRALVEVDTGSPELETVALEDLVIIG